MSEIITIGNEVDLNELPAGSVARNKLAAGTANHVIINDSAGAMSSEASLAVSRGGTALTALGTANQVLGVNNAANAAEYKTISGTTNRVSVTHGANSVTLSAPQDLHTGATPTFDSLTITSSATIGGRSVGLLPTLIMQKTGSQNISNNTGTPIEWDSVLLENINVFSVASDTTFTLHEVGTYLITWSVTFGADADGYRGTWFFMNGESSGQHANVRVPATPTLGTRLTTSEVFRTFSENETLITYVGHTAGATIAITSESYLSIVKLSS